MLHGLAPSTVIGGGSQPAPVRTDYGNIATQLAITLTESVECGEGGRMAIAIAVGNNQGDGRQISSITLGGITGTQHVTVPTGNTAINLSLTTFEDVPAGANSLVVTMNTSGNHNASFELYQLNGRIFHDSATHDGTASNLALSADVSADGFAVGLSYFNSNPDAASWSSGVDETLVTSINISGNQRATEFGNRYYENESLSQSFATSGGSSSNRRAFVATFQPAP